MWASRRKKKRRASNVALPRAVYLRERKRGTYNSVVKAGLWKVAAPLLFCLDLLYPTITRTLLQLFTCHDLGSAGRWLEADYSVSCASGGQYSSYLGVTGFFAIMFSVGIPFLFHYLVKRYQALGKRGDKVVQAAIGWCYEPYRPGYEWWLHVDNCGVCIIDAGVQILIALPACVLQGHGNDPCITIDKYHRIHFS